MPAMKALVKLYSADGQLLDSQVMQFEWVKKNEGKPHPPKLVAEKEPLEGARHDFRQAADERALKFQPESKLKAPQLNKRGKPPPNASDTTIVQPVPKKRDKVPVSRVEAVAVDGNDGLGLCAAGKVIGLDPRGDNFLSVRSGPGGQPFRELDRLFSAETVYVCGRTAAWYAVVYPATRKFLQDCDIVGQGRAYEGSCRHGWVYSRYVKVLPNRN